LNLLSYRLRRADRWTYAFAALSAVAFAAFVGFGRGSEDLYRAAEIGWNAATAFGAGALVLAVFSPRPWCGSVPSPT
jgi:hypothetical protein